MLRISGGVPPIPPYAFNDMGKNSCILIILGATLLPDRKPVYGQRHSQFWLLNLQHPEQLAGTANW